MVIAPLNYMLQVAYSPIITDATAYKAVLNNCVLPDTCGNSLGEESRCQGCTNFWSISSLYYMNTLLYFIRSFNGKVSAARAVSICTMYHAPFPQSAL